MNTSEHFARSDKLKEPRNFSESVNDSIVHADNINGNKRTQSIANILYLANLLGNAFINKDKMYKARERTK